MKCLVSGGGGFIGSNLVDELILQGNEVTVLDNFSTGKREYLNPQADLIEADAQSVEILEPYNVIFHLAALARIQPSIEFPLEAHAANLTSTVNMLNHAKKWGAKFIFSSSSSVYGAGNTPPFNEAMTPKPDSPYALQKYASEHYCRIYHELFGLDTVCLRYFNVYGERQPTTGAYAVAMGIFLRQMKEGRPITIFGGEQRRDFCVSGDTPVLMDDLSWRLIKDIRVGDSVVSFGGVINKKRNFVISRVVATSNYISGNVYEIKTSDGKVTHATGNHPWLNTKNSYSDTDKLKKLLNNNQKSILKEFGGEPFIHKETSDYKIGYVVGAIDGDGFCSHYKSGKSTNYCLGLEVTDKEFAERYYKYSCELGIKNRAIKTRQPKYLNSKLVYVVGSGHKDDYILFNNLIDKLDWSNKDICRGWLAGMFDSEGEAVSGRTLRLSNKDIKICERMRDILRVFKFTWSERKRGDGLVIFTITGGLNGVVRFFATIRPAISRKRPIMDTREVKGKTRLIVSIKKIPPTEVYNLQVDNTETYIANGFLCHNTHVKDVVRANIEAVNAPHGIYNVGTGTNYSINEIVDLISKDHPREYSDYRSGEYPKTLADMSKFLSTFGWKPQSIVPNWIKQNGT